MSVGVGRGGGAVEGVDEVTGREQTVQTCFEAEMAEMGCPENG